MKYCTYILFSREINKYYIGQTGSFVTRMQHHIEGETQSTKCTSDWELVFLEPAATLQDAMALERRIKKSKSRKSIQRYINNKLNIIRDPIGLNDVISGNNIT